MAAAKIPVRGKGQKTCMEHKEKELELFCEKCQEPACVICVASSHKGHVFCMLSEITSKKNQHIINFIERTEQNELVQIENYIDSANALLKDNNRTFERLLDQLKTQTEKLKRELDNMTAEIVTHYQKMKEDNANIIKKYKEDLEMYIKLLKEQMQECKTALQQGSPIEIYDTECEIDSLLHIPVKPVLDTVRFTPNENPRNHLELALGTRQSVDAGQTSTLRVTDRSVSLSQEQGESSTQQQSGGERKKVMISTKLLTETRVIEEWKSPCDITCICPTTNDQVWTSHEYSGTLTLLDRKGKVIQKVTHKVGIKDISLSPTTHRLWACDGDSNILELISGQLTKRFRTKNKLRCICVTADNHIIIGMHKRITKYTIQGQMMLTTEAAGTVKPLVYTPYKITECPITNNIAVVDHSSKCDGGDGHQRVIVMDTKFRILFIYRGDIPRRYQEILQLRDRPFSPRDIVFDSQGKIIIADYGKEKTYLLNCDGNMLGILPMVWTIGVRRQGDLWTADINDYVKLLQYY